MSGVSGVKAPGERYTCYVVEWDIPSNSAARRARFYRALKKLWKTFEGEKEMSTMSVLITPDEELAWAVYNTARLFGVSHLYEARQLE